MTRDQIIERARDIAETPFNIAYISRSSSQHVRAIMRALLTLVPSPDTSVDDLARYHAARARTQWPFGDMANNVRDGE